MVLTGLLYPAPGQVRLVLAGAAEARAAGARVSVRDLRPVPADWLDSLSHLARHRLRVSLCGRVLGGRWYTLSIVHRALRNAVDHKKRHGSFAHFQSQAGLLFGSEAAVTPSVACGPASPTPFSQAEIAG